MDFNPLSTQNWSRAFNFCFGGIHVRIQPVVDLERRIIQGGLLRRARSGMRVYAVVVALFFSLHCTRPGAEVVRPSSVPTGIEEPSPAGYSEVGEATWYGGAGDGFAGRPTASGEPMDPARPTCAHRTLPLGTWLEVENLENGRKLLLRVNDRGPFVRNRILDVSQRAAFDLGFHAKGSTRVRLRAVRPDGSPFVGGPLEEAGNPLTIQVAALAEEANVDRLTRELGDAFGPVSVESAFGRDGRPVKRVRAGSFTRMEDAQRALNEIVKRFGDRGVEPFILRRR